MYAFGLRVAEDALWVAALVEVQRTEEEKANVSHCLPRDRWYCWGLDLNGRFVLPKAWIHPWRIPKHLDFPGWPLS